MKEPNDEKNLFGSSLENLYAHLNPAGIDSKLVSQKKVNIKSAAQILKDSILGSNGDVYTWGDLNKKIGEYFSAPNRNQEGVKAEKETLAQRFHAISTDSVNGVLDLDDQDYWGKDTKNLNNFVPSLADSLKRNKKCVVSAFVSRDPYVSPSTRASDKVEIFLNYLPSLAVAQMVPFLEVEFDLLGQKQSSSISTPSYMRFLLGSTDVLQENSYDRTLFAGDIVDRQKTTEDRKGQQVQQTTNVMRSGVETFLMPQTLTNMDELGPGPKRLIRAKPFVPFASIEGFDVSIQNAGAGSMIHKTGNLKIKIHDKARISEFSEFIRGPSGYASAIIWTKYGWSAPVGRQEDAYSNFINENFFTEDCWMVKDAQFSFDASGQVSLTLQLISRGIRDMQKVMISAGSSLASAQNNLKKSIEIIQHYMQILKRDQAFSVDVTMTQVLNAAATTGNIGAFKNVEATTKKIQAMAERSGISLADAQELKNELDKLTSKKGDNVYSNYVDSIPNVVAEKFNNLNVGADPFLPRRAEPSAPGKKERELSKYFPDTDLLDAIDVFQNSWKDRNVKIQQAIDNQNESNQNSKEPESVVKPINLNKAVNVVSFGKLFMNFAASALVSLGDTDELQIFFYPMNDFSGPMSGYSLAEFPIDVTALAYSYAEELKRLATAELTLQQFLKLVIDSQFADIRAIGYGRNSFYKPYTGPKSKPEKEEGDDVESKDANWTVKYGGWRPPLIDFYVETGEYKDDNGTKRFEARKHRNDTENVTKGGVLVKRLHIFDKQLNPYRLAQSILSGDSGYERGDVNKGKLDGVMRKITQGLSKKQLKELADRVNTATMSNQNRTDNNAPSQQTRLEEDRKTYKALREIDSKIPAEAQVVDRPGRMDYKIKFDGNKREVIKAELMRFVPTISPGTNGSLVQTINVGSKTDGTMGAANLYRVVKGGTGKSALSPNGLEEINELPLRTVPIQLTMTSLGCPNAGLYQDYFFDLNTGTTIDNLYKCTQMQHQMAAGKFTTNWTFAFTDGYGKFGSPPTVAGLITKFFRDDLNRLTGDETRAATPAQSGRRVAPRPRSEAKPQTLLAVAVKAFTSSPKPPASPTGK